MCNHQEDQHRAGRAREIWAREGDHAPPWCRPVRRAFPRANPTLRARVCAARRVVDGAIGAANLYGGVPTRASEINTETQFALEHWGVDLPPPVEDLLAERCVLVPNVRFSPVHRFQHLIASPFN